ncbi:hypothetical protein GWI33_009228 [Rhynchophorus ferrugineus]|uniref:Uncharacterized protein n=1 Tax=Rhynchophorus ferrugineus TaxID=354439 RepID=A0A834MAH5_RHYFE|nr:hypothetical protein GWI33_009228 [Rhynchophorus ferrugineus]
MEKSHRDLGHYGQRRSRTASSRLRHQLTSTHERVLAFATDKDPAEILQSSGDSLQSITDCGYAAMFVPPLGSPGPGRSRGENARLCHANGPFSWHVVAVTVLQFFVDILLRHGLAFFFALLYF